MLSIDILETAIELIVTKTSLYLLTKNFSQGDFLEVFFFLTSAHLFFEDCSAFGQLNVGVVYY